MNAVLRQVCLANILRALQRLKQHADPGVVQQATLVEGLFLDFKSYDEPAPQSDAPAPVSHDTTNYERYALLRSFGLSPEQLIDVARSDGLHELRIIRMLRLTFELGLAEATALKDARKATD